VDCVVLKLISALTINETCCCKCCFTEVEGRSFSRETRGRGGRANRKIQKFTLYTWAEDQDASFIPSYTEAGKLALENIDTLHGIQRKLQRPVL
jgi:hypothetical protein